MIFPAYIFTKDPTVDSPVGLNHLFITIYRGSSLYFLIEHLLSEGPSWGAWPAFEPVSLGLSYSNATNY
jgi:hypothetical protein